MLVHLGDFQDQAIELRRRKSLTLGVLRCVTNLAANGRPLSPPLRVRFSW